jgi:LacI family transcriptional regulator
MPRSRTRLKDIAAATGFSVNTVSLALRSSQRITQETIDTILAAAERLEYLPNHVARSLVSQATNTIGLVLTDIMNPTQARTARSIEQRLGEAHYSMMLAATDNVLANEINALEILCSQQVDGILIYPTHHRELDHLNALRRKGYPIVLLGADRNVGVDVVAVDDHRGAYKAVSHLTKLGHRRIGFLDSAGPMGNTEKYEGYEQALRENRISVDHALIVDPCGHGEASGYEAMTRLMATSLRPTALFAPNDNLALGAMAWCRHHGVPVPSELSIVGYDNVEASKFADVALTTINYDVQSVSEFAIARLLELIGNEDQAPAVTLIEPELVIRDSSQTLHRIDL